MMIIFCEECGAKNSVDPEGKKENTHTISCCSCGEILVIKTLGEPGKKKYQTAAKTKECD